MADTKSMIAAINRAVTEDDFNLTEWETEFIESISRRVEAGESLSDKQDETLLKIWRKATE